jgi:hypothetical protein
MFQLFLTLNWNCWSYYLKTTWSLFGGKDLTPPSPTIYVWGGTKNLEWSISCDSLPKARTNLAKGPQFFLFSKNLPIYSLHSFLYNFCENYEFENQLLKKLKNWKPGRFSKFLKRTRTHNCQKEMREPPYTGHDSLPCKGKLNSGAQIRCTTSTQGPQCCWHISMYGTRYGSLWNTLLSDKPFALWPSALYHFVLFCFSKITVGDFLHIYRIIFVHPTYPQEKKKSKKKWSISLSWPII